MEFGTFLAGLRKERGILQKELANYLNVTVATVSNYEKNVHSPDIHMLVKIANFFGVSTDYLLQRTDCKVPISTVNTRLSDQYTLGDLMDITLELDCHDKEFLVDFYDLLALRNTINCRSVIRQRHFTDADSDSLLEPHEDF